MGETDVDTLRTQLEGMISAAHREFADKLLSTHGVPAMPDDSGPDPLGMPLQGMVSFDAVRRTKTYAGVAETQKVAFNPVGQVVGQINHVESTRQVMQRLLEEYVAALDRVNGLMPDS